MGYFFRKLLILILAFSVTIAFADVKRPVKNKKSLNSPVNEYGIKVRTAKVLLVDYDLVRKDFPAVQGMSESEIDKWLHCCPVRSTA